jgi:hypothetical protein
MTIQVIALIVTGVLTLVLFILGIVGALVGIIYNSLAKRIAKLEDETITRNTCNQCARNKDDKIEALTKMFDTRSLDVVGIVGKSNELMEQILKERK